MSAKMSADSSMSVVVRGVQFDVPTRILFENLADKFGRVLTENSDSQKLALAGRDPTIFGCIIGFYTSGSLHVPHGTCATLVKEELEFWEISVKRLCLSCYKRYKQDIDETEDMDNCIQLWRKQSSGENSIKVSCESMSKDNAQDTSQVKLWTFLEQPNSSKVAIAYAGFIMVINLLSVLLPTLETVASLREPFDKINSTSNQTINEHALSNPTIHFSNTIDMIHASIPKSWILILDAVLVGLLTIDFTLRFYAAHVKTKFFKSFINIVGMLSLIPIWVQVIIYKTMRFVNLEFYVLDIVHNIMALAVLRVLYLFRMAQWYTPMRIILLALRESRRELFLLAVILTLNSVLFGFLVYTAEISNNTFWSIPDGIYWAVITMTTVGYGDMYPVGEIGKLIGCCCALSGILLIALPVPVIANNFIKFNMIAKITNYTKHDGREKKAAHEKI